MKSITGAEATSLERRVFRSSSSGGCCVVVVEVVVGCAGGRARVLPLCCVIERESFDGSAPEIWSRTFLDLVKTKKGTEETL